MKCLRCQQDNPARSKFCLECGAPLIASGNLLPVVPGTVAGRSVLERRTVHVFDVLNEADEFPESAAFARGLGFRTLLSVPLLREEAPLGVIQLRRAEVKPFTDRQVALLQTFADQAVIAIENVRLFKELQERNQALTQAHAQVTEALDRQTATAEILRIIRAAREELPAEVNGLGANAAQMCWPEDGVVLRP